ncbi:tRNA dihydrouridine synthase DusB [Candidatus Woesearchaeota archaeon]|nr:tRNA dihydrouridine synthase DusB [Candidatus Woesearchaeota archaeon]
MKLPKFKSQAFFAPMAGISDPAFRTLCAEMGAGLVVTELTSINAIVAKEKILKKDGKKISEFIEFSEKERPISIQLFGSDIKLLSKSAQIVEPYFDIIDYNMGCPAPHITNQMAGAALLQKPDLTKKIFTTLINAVDKPITLKMRTGVNNSDCYLWKPVAKIAEDCGISMITLHPRTIKQGYSGKADWNMIKELRSVVNEQVKVVGNGDITKPEDAKKMIEQTGCNYIMIGRGAMGNPQIFSQINSEMRSERWSETTFEEKKKTLHKYLELTKKYPTIKFASIRTQAMQFTKGIKGGKELRNKIARAQTMQEIKEKFK